MREKVVRSGGKEVGRGEGWIVVENLLGSGGKGVGRGEGWKAGGEGAQKNSKFRAAG